MIAELQSRDRSHLSFIRGSVYAALRSVRAAGWLCASYVVDVVARACIEFNIRCVGVFASVSARLPVMAGEGRGWTHSGVTAATTHYHVERCASAYFECSQCSIIHR